MMTVSPTARSDRTVRLWKVPEDTQLVFNGAPPPRTQINMPAWVPCYELVC